MRLERCKDQARQTLDEFYTERAGSEDQDSQLLGRAMFSLICRLRGLPEELTVWGLTSHEHLWLLSEDDSRARWKVGVIAMSPECYVIEYQMPAELAPWPEARVQGRARSEDQAIEMIEIAMERTGGWR